MLLMIMIQFLRYCWLLISRQFLWLRLLLTILSTDRGGFWFRALFSLIAFFNSGQAFSNDRVLFNIKIKVHFFTFSIGLSSIVYLLFQGRALSFFRYRRNFIARLATTLYKKSKRKRKIFKRSRKKFHLHSDSFY